MTENSEKYPKLKKRIIRKKAPNGQNAEVFAQMAESLRKEDPAAIRRLCRVYTLALKPGPMLEVCEAAHSDHAKAALIALIGHKATEHVAVLYIGAQNTVVGAEIVAQGGMNHAALTARQVFMGACVYGACGIVLGHNHPSGFLTPSPEDVEMTRHIEAAGIKLGIPMLDHIIVNTHEGRSIPYDARI